MKCYKPECSKEGLENQSFVQIQYSEHSICSGCNRPNADTQKMAYFCSVACAVGVEVSKPKPFGAI